MSVENDDIMRTNLRIVEVIDDDEHQPITDSSINIEIDHGPIIGYTAVPLVPLANACAPLVNMVYNLLFYVQLAINETPDVPPDGLTVDESAAIRLYTMEWQRPHRSLYSILNHTLKTSDRKDLEPYFKYMKLFFTALAKLPCMSPSTVWRGVTKNLNEDFSPGTSITWWAFSSCTTTMTVLNNSTYLGKAGPRTLFSIETINGRTIRAHSHFANEDEILLLPGTRMIVQSKLNPAPDLHIIHLKQVIPKETLLELPFKGANLYPKSLRRWYQKKRFTIPISVITTISIAAVILVYFMIQKPPHQPPCNTPYKDSVPYSTGHNPSSVTFSYSNKDANDKRSLLTVANTDDNTIAVLTADKNGIFYARGIYHTGDSPKNVISADFDNDNKLDLAITNTDDNTISVLLGNGDGTFQNQSIYHTGTAPQSIVSADFNNDDKPDLAVANSQDNTISVLLGNGDGTFQNQSIYDSGEYPGSITSGDFNNDKKADLALTNKVTNTVSVLLGKGDGTFQNRSIYKTGNGPSDVISADFNNDNKLDLVVANFHHDTISVLLGYGDGTFRNQSIYNTGNGPISLVPADVNNDHKPDLVVTNSQNNTISVLLGNGDGTFQNQTIYHTGTEPLYIVSADFNNDGKPDLAVANTVGNTISILLGNGDGTFRNQSIYNTGNGPQPLVSADFNNDDKSDLAVTNSLGNTISVLLGNGDGTFQNQSIYNTGNEPQSLVSADFNNDEKVDIAVAHDKDNICILLGDGSGTFETKQWYNAYGVVSLAVGDFNNNNKIDLAAISSLEEKLLVFLNQC